ncbi:MAG: hypothetical protein AB7U79_03500 [Candidatus Izemoplasmatales bacterium]
MKRNEWKKLIKSSVETNIPYQHDFVEKIIQDSKEPMYPSKKLPVFRIAMASFGLFIISFLSFIGYKSYYTVTSSFTLDINPSVEVFMNKYDKVIDITPINDDGVLLLSSMNKSSGNVDLVLDDILDTSEDLGFLTSESQTILIGVSSDTYLNQINLESDISAYFSNNSYQTFVIPTSSINVEAIFTLFSTVTSPEVTESPAKTDENDIQDYFNDVINSGVDATYGESQTYTSSSYTSLKSYYTSIYNISEAHFALVMMIVELDEQYQDVSQITTLLGLNIDDLVALYNSLIQ